MRTKHVFTGTDEIARLWANQSQDSARNPSGNFYFEGKTIYSYGSHFPIARHVENKDGERAILFTQATYSNTTSKHVHTVRYAARNKRLVYCPSLQNNQSENLSQWLSRIEISLKFLQKARKPEIYKSEIRQYYNEAETYCNFFGITIPVELTTALAFAEKEKVNGYWLHKLMTAA